MTIIITLISAVALVYGLLAAVVIRALLTAEPDPDETWSPEREAAWKAKLTDWN